MNGLKGRVFRVKFAWKRGRSLANGLGLKGARNDFLHFLLDDVLALFETFINKFLFPNKTLWIWPLYSLISTRVKARYLIWASWLRYFDPSESGCAIYYHWVRLLILLILSYNHLFHSVLYPCVLKWDRVLLIFLFIISHYFSL